MYDRPETRGANDRLWDFLRREIGIAPSALSRGRDPWDDWQSSELFLSQTCGLPFRMSLHKSIHLVATPDHRLERCAPGMYRSALICRKGDVGRITFGSQRFACNGQDSQSGWAAPWTFAQDKNISLAPSLITGSHLDAARSVAEGQADFAAIDAVTWGMIQKWEGFADELAVFDWTQPTPALPFISAKADMVIPLQRALKRAIAALSPDDQTTLQLFGVVEIPKQDYLALPIPPQTIQTRG